MTVDGVDLPDGAFLQAPDGGLQLVQSFGGADRWTGFLARGDGALAGLGFLACAVLLAPVIHSVAGGDPFRTGNAARSGGDRGDRRRRRPGGADAAGDRGDDRARRPGPRRSEQPVLRGISLSFIPLGVCALIFVLAEAFRRGTQISADAAGLV